MPARAVVMGVPARVVREAAAAPSALAPGRGTLALGALATGAVAAVVAHGGEAECGGAARRRCPRDTDNPLLAAEEAVAEAARVARAGYREGSTRENSMFNLLTSFVATFILVRSITFALRERNPSFGPLRNVRVGRRHIHHFVPGNRAGVRRRARRRSSPGTRRSSPGSRCRSASAWDSTLDESALLLELDDVYWNREEGLLSVQITLAVMALLAALAIALRFLWRGEQVVLEPPTP